MNIIAPFVADSQTPKLVQPCDGSLHHPSGFSQTTAVRSSAFRQDRFNPSAIEQASMHFAIVGAVGLNRIGLATWVSTLAANRRNTLHQRHQLGQIMTIGARQARGQRNAVPVGDHMMFATAFAPVCRVGACVRPPFNARIELLSTTARDQSIWSARLSWAKRTSWIFCQTPASCQSRSLRQQLIPDPHLISWGKSSHGMPVFRTKRMPVRAARFSMGLRPGNRKRLGLGDGRSGLISDHNSSERIARAIGFSPYWLTFPNGFYRRPPFRLKSFC